jgi:hypothetical protein
MIATLRQRNENFILWSAVKDVQGVFTPLGPVNTKHIMAVVVTRHGTAIEGNGTFAVHERFVEPMRLTHDEMIALAEKTPPPQEWFEEDFSGLRKQGR